MLELKSRGFKELGTKKMWDWVDVELKKNGTPPFKDWQNLVDTLVDSKLLDRPLPSSGIARGPRGLGERPKWSPETAALIRNARVGGGLAARHVIASSTLGLAIERASASLDELNGWLAKHQRPPQRYGHPQTARRAIWDVVHNHAGNLWMGSTGPNTAIGFVGPRLVSIREHLPVNTQGEVDIVQTRKLVEQAMVAPGGQDNERNQTWNLLLGDLAAELGAFEDTGTRHVPLNDVVDLIDMYCRNADIDPPSLTNNEYRRIVQVWWDLKEPSKVLKGLDDFMQLSLTGSIVYAPPR
jgi:hypothetical protein